MFTATIAVLALQSSGEEFVRFHSGPGGNADSTTCAHTGQDGARYFGGYQFTDKEYKFDFFLIAMDNKGEVLWRRTYGPQRGGDKIPGYSERYWRNDIPSDITSDEKGNVFICGTSTFGPGDEDFGAVVVSYTKDGKFRFATRIRDWSAASNHIVSRRGLTFVTGSAGVGEQRRKRRDHGYPVHVVAIDDGGKVKWTIDLGLDRSAGDIANGPDGTVEVLLRNVGKIPYIQDIDAYTWAMYRPEAPSNVTSWIKVRVSEKGRVVSKVVIDSKAHRLRGTGLLVDGGGVVTIDGHPDGFDRLTHWDPAGKPLWSQKFEDSVYLTSEPNGDRFHRALNRSLAASGKTIYTSTSADSVPPNWKTNGKQVRWGASIDKFSLGTGEQIGQLAYDTNAGPIGLNVLDASRRCVLAGGSIYVRGSNDAWMISWPPSGN